MPLMYKHQAPRPDLSNLFSVRSKKEKEPTEKDRLGFMKDAYTFLKANKDNLNDPRVGEVAMSMLTNAGLQPVMEPSAQQGTQAGGAKPEKVSPNWARTMDMLYDRFASEHKELFQPQRFETMEGGRPGTRFIEPLAPTEERRSRFFEAQPQVMAAGSELVRQGPGEPEVLHRVETAKEKQGKPNWKITPQEDGSYKIVDLKGWEKPSVVFPTIPVYERGPRQAKAVLELVQEAWEEAALDLADEIKAGAFEKEKGFLNIQALGGESPEEYQKRINEYREERFDYHLDLRGLTRKDIPKGWKSYSPATKGGTVAPTPESRPTATNPQTGEKVIWNGKAWVPVKK